MKVKKCAICKKPLVGYTGLRKYCSYQCAKKAAKKRTKTRKAGVNSLRRQADHLFQIKLIKLKPKSIISGEPTEVIHHFVPKSQSNNLRYDTQNGIPLTNKEHCQHHLSGDPFIVAMIVNTLGKEWFDDLQIRRLIPRKLTTEYLMNIIRKW
jgi:hypothetical protein